MRRQLFVHCLLLALCIAGPVLAGKYPQTDVGAVSIQEFNLEVANTVTTGAQQGSNISMSAHNADVRQRLLVAAADSPPHETNSPIETTSETSSQQESEKGKIEKTSVKPELAPKVGTSQEKTVSGKESKQTKKPEKTQSFQDLDNEAENILRSVLDLSSDMHILEEQHNNPPKNQLVVLVTLQPSSFFELDYVEVVVDGQTVAGHPYTEKEISALIRGGGHRIYIANLPAGMHELRAMFVGKVPRDPDYQREANFKFISGVDRTVIELYVNSTETSGFPQFTIREWN